MSNISTYIIGAIILCLIVAGGASLMGMVADKDISAINGQDMANFNSTFNKQAIVVEKVNSMKDAITTNAQPEFGLFGVLNGLIQTAWNVLQTVFTSFDFVTDIFAKLDDYYGIPAWVGTLVTALIFVVIIFAIFGAIFQRDV